MAVDLAQLAALLEASLDHNRNKQAEHAILQQEAIPSFSISLLQIVASDSYSITIRLASALYFKNFIKRNWTDEDGKHKLPSQEVAAIKQELIGLMISIPATLQSQLGDAVSIIAESDFWDRWDTLVQDLASRLTSDDTKTRRGVLHVAHSIFKRWRPLYRSDPLFTEINHVLSHFGQPFLSELQRTDQQIQENRESKDQLIDLFTNLNLLLKLMYDLSVQDLPPIFEENLDAIINLLHKYLTYDNELLKVAEDDPAGPLELAKAGILSILELWIQKYEEEFGPHVNQFIVSSWTLLTTVPLDAKYDLLASKALQFLTAVSQTSNSAQAFDDKATLTQIVERVVLPNLTLRDSDMELFEDEPIEFIRRDIEGADSDTRRRASTDLLKGLMSRFESLVGPSVMHYVGIYLQDYARDPNSNWKAKDTATYMFSAVAAKGASTSSHGVTQIYESANIIQFFQDNLAQDLLPGSSAPSILKTGAMKYLYTFRSMINGNDWQQILSLLMTHLQTSEYIVYTYASITIERALALTDASKKLVVDSSVVQPIAAELLQNLFILIKHDSEPAKIQENEFLMRSVMRILVVIREGLVPLSNALIGNLADILRICCQNPSNPRFNYYLFEAIGASIRFGAPSKTLDYQAAFYVTFAQVLQNDVQEFVPYVFQLFAALFEATPKHQLPEPYQKLVISTLNPSVWSSKGNTPALTRLLCSAMQKESSIFLQDQNLQMLLGIFQQLIAAKSSEVFGFQLLESIISSFEVSELSSYYVPILRVLLTRLQNSRTDAFTVRFVRLYHYISAKQIGGLGPDFFISQTEEIQAGVFTPIYLTIILPETQKLLRPLDRKIAVISLATTLTKSSAFADRYKKGWAFTCNALLKLLESPPVASNSDDTMIEQDPDDMSFGVGFTQLSTVKQSAKDEWPDIQDVRKWVSETLRGTDAGTGGRISGFAQERLPPESKVVLAAYLPAISA